MNGSGFSSSLRIFLQDTARLALFALVFQLIAVDHWQTDPSNVIGIENSAQHVAHCHGGDGSCADSASMGAVGLPSQVTAPSAPLVLSSPVATSVAVPPQANLTSIDEPPRAA